MHYLNKQNKPVLIEFMLDFLPMLFLKKKKKEKQVYFQSSFSLIQQKMCWRFTKEINF